MQESYQLFSRESHFAVANNIIGVMVGVLASSVVDRGFEQNTM
jgi:hypothetical protein